MSGPIYSWIAALALIDGLKQHRLNRQSQAAAAIRPGDDQACVAALLGPPQRRIFLTWAYGATFDLGDVWASGSSLPCLLPLRLRILGPDEDDLVVHFNWDGTVASIERPPDRPR